MKTEPLVRNQFYHIYNRGNNREDLFIEEKNYPYFLNLVKKHVLPIADVYAYCLLKNHFHLLIQTNGIDEEHKISKGFSNLFNSYTKSFNKAYKRTGSLFSKPFSRLKITKEDYLRSLIIYIHLNPRHHGFVSNFESYLHSSYSALTQTKNTSLKREEVIALFDDLDNFIFCHRNKEDFLDEKDLGLTLE